MRRLIITATDTDVGKTVFAAMLTLALGAVYWKPIQSGIADGTDTETVRRLAGLPEQHVRPEGYRLSQPLSPHRAAELDGLTIDDRRLEPPDDLAPGQALLIEGAGGVLVPVTRALLQIELFARWQAPVIICARTRLGTINHTLLTIEALHRRGLPICGIAFIGEAMPDTERTIADLAKDRAGVPVLGRLPWLPLLDAPSLLQAFDQHFRRADFAHGMGATA
jgi:dethiobiotin synthetase